MQSHPTTTRGTPTQHLHRMSNDQLVVRYQELNAFLTRRARVPRRLLAPLDPGDRATERRSANEMARIRAIARARGLKLEPKPVVPASPARDEMYRALELAERIIANLPSEEMLTNRIAEAMAYGARCEHEQLKRESWKMRVLLPIQQRDVIAEREALKKAERAAQPKTEWLEELDYA